MNKDKKAIIFDMDGTIVDNMMVHHYAWQKQLALNGIDFSLNEVIEKCHGKNLEILERLFGNRFSEAERIEFSNAKEKTYRDIYAKDVKPIGGLIELLQIAQNNGIPIGIGTAAQYENVNFILDTLGIRQYFDTIVADVDVKNGKPHPEVFFKVAENLGVRPNNCLVFEDSPVGAHTAKNAGMKAIVLTTTHKKEEFVQNEFVIKCVENYSGINILNELVNI